MVDIGFTDVGCGSVDWNRAGQDRSKLQIFAITLLKLRNSQKAWSVLTS